MHFWHHSITRRDVKTSIMSRSMIESFIFNRKKGHCEKDLLEEENKSESHRKLSSCCVKNTTSK